MSVFRYPHNPIIKPEDVKPSREDFEVVCAFNPGVIRFGDEVILLIRVAERPKNPNSSVYLAPVFDPDENRLIVKAFETDNPDYDFSDPRSIQTPAGPYLTSISHLRIARSKDGVNFEIEETPALFPANVYETYGIEDARITFLDGTYFINYSAVSRLGVTTYLASTADFRSFRRRGVIFAPENKDVEIFPEKINGKYYALTRPSGSGFGRPEIWLAESPDLMCWGNHRHLVGLREGYWDDSRIGGSAVPFRIEEGWLEIYHGANKDNRYCLGALLLDGEKPWQVLARSGEPIIEPEADYELAGFFGNVIFACGALYEEDKVKIYYGAADAYIGYAEVRLEDILQGFDR